MSGGGTTLTETAFPPKSSFTVADELVFHYISDEELQMLADEKHEPWMQVFWACVGICAGAAQGTVAAFATLISGEGPVALADLVPAFSLASAIPLGTAAFLAARARERKVKKMQARIRARHKVTPPSNLRLDHDPGDKPEMPSGADGHG